MSPLGNSGARLVFNTTTVEKSAVGAAAERLKRQCEKQRRFRSTHATAPTVRSVSESTDFSFTMDRIGDGDLIGNAERWLPSIRAYLFETVAASPLEHVRGAVFLTKLDAVTHAAMENLAAAPLAERWMPVFDSFRPLLRVGCEIPVGECHGDLTLCNILWDGRLHFIDFLDSFVESPLIDMVKLRQDTQHRWITLFTPVDDAALARIDSALQSMFEEWRFYRVHYGALQMLNLARLLPYAANATVAEFVTEKLERCTP